MNAPLVLFETLPSAGGARIALATLNSPATLNALNATMVERLAAQLTVWERDPGVALVILRGAGDKAFCAGGDVKALRQSIVDHPAPAPHPAALALFIAEYGFDYRLHHYAKPLLAWGDGIVMGGGMGLLQASPFRVVTERSRLAMPEVNIGLYPDVGASYFLSRIPQRLGLFLGMTGVTFNAADAMYCGLADYLLAAQSLPSVLERLQQTVWHHDPVVNRAQLDSLLKQCAQQIPTNAPLSLLLQHAGVIGQTLTGETFLADYRALCALQQHEDIWLRQAAMQLAAGSPSTAALSWEMQRRGGNMNLADVFKMELTVSVNRCVQHDFLEGVRARLVDKDSPRRQPATAEAVSRQDIDCCFTEPWAEHPLAGLHASVK